MAERDNITKGRKERRLQEEKSEEKKDMLGSESWDRERVRNKTGKEEVKENEDVHQEVIEVSRQIGI
jgi:hypothetical protein